MSVTLADTNRYCLSNIFCSNFLSFKLLVIVSCCRLNLIGSRKHFILFLKFNQVWNSYLYSFIYYLYFSPCQLDYFCRSNEWERKQLSFFSFFLSLICTDEQTDRQTDRYDWYNNNRSSSSDNVVTAAHSFSGQHAEAVWVMIHCLSLAEFAARRHRQIAVTLSRPAAAATESNMRKEKKGELSIWN